jgi:hypothetical protein
MGESHLEPPQQLELHFPPPHVGTVKKRDDLTIVRYRSLRNLASDEHRSKKTMVVVLIIKKMMGVKEERWLGYTLRRLST